MPEYPQEIINNAKQYGFKASNLMFLEGCVQEFEQVRGSEVNTVAIPPIKAISNDAITAHLKSYIANFDEMWSEFCTLQKGKDAIGEGAKQVLAKLQIAISQSFIDHPFVLDNVPVANKYMVRSTGEEDRVDVANPGGNESVASLAVDLSQSIGTVIASYLSEKSLLQRIKSGEDITDHFPLSPCLVQVMIGVNSKGKQPISGVIYTDDGHSRVQAAPGHGELIVNSKGNFDNYYATPQGKIYAEVRDKHVRLTPKMNDQTGQMEQIEEANDFRTATNPSLDKDAAGYLHNLSKFIEQKYGMRMDIEFVYDSSSKTVNIVQARPIPEGDRRGLRPSALSNQFISESNPKNLKGSVITPDINSVSVITNSEQILICDNIEQALATYLKGANQYKAVIVRNEAPDTSHESGMFTSKAIPVLQMDNLDEAKQWAVNLDNNVMVCDPQHKKLYQISKDQYSANLIQDGVFASTLSPYITPFKRRAVAEVDIIRAQEAIRSDAPVQRYTGRLMFLNLDALAIPQFGGDVEEQKDTLASLLKFSARMLKNNKISADLFKEIMLAGAEMRSLLNEMQGEEYTEKKAKYYLDVFEKFNGLMLSQRKKDILSSSVVHEISYAKTHKKYQQVAMDMEESNTTREYYLGVLHEHKVVLSDRQRDLFLEVVKLDKFVMNSKNKQKWQEFCFEICKNNQGLVLANLSKGLVKIGLHEYFLNNNFIESYSKDGVKALANLYQVFEIVIDKMGDISSADRVISQMEYQIAEWSKPEKFEDLRTNLQENLVELEKLLHFQEKAALNEALKDKLYGVLLIKQLNRLIDVVDLSMKALQTSSLYGEVPQKTKENNYASSTQENNFLVLVNDFYGLMQKLIAKHNVKEQRFNGRIDQVTDAINNKNKHEYYSDIFCKKMPVSFNELETSDSFDVVSADLYQPSPYDKTDSLGTGEDSFRICFVKKFGKTLADIHSFLHQTLLNSIVMHATDINSNLLKVSPLIVQEIHKYYQKGNQFLNFSVGKEAYSFKFCPDLISSNIDHPHVQLHYNIPLRQHSAFIKLNYNYSSNKIKILYEMAGASENRWKRLTHLGRGFLEDIVGAKVIKSHASSSYMAIEVEVSNLEMVKRSLDIFNTLSLATFYMPSLYDGFKNNGFLRALYNRFENNGFLREGIFYSALEKKFNQAIGSFNLKKYTKDDVEFIKNLYTSGIISLSYLKNPKHLDKLQRINNAGIKADDFIAQYELHFYVDNVRNLEKFRKAFNLDYDGDVDDLRSVIYAEKDQARESDYIDKLLTAYKDNPIGFIRYIYAISKRNPNFTEEDSKKIAEFLNQEVAGGNTTNFRKIIKEGNREYFDLALSFKPKSAGVEKEFIKKFYPEAKVNAQQATQAK